MADGAVTNNVVEMSDFKARLAREGRAERLADLAEELCGMSSTSEGRAYLAGYYEAKGWATKRDLMIALAMIDDVGGWTWETATREDTWTP
jgi:hypothetical protein